MSKTKTILTFLAVGALFFAFQAGAANISVTSPGLGNETSASCPTGCKLAVELNGDTSTAFVISEDPNSERVMRTVYLINMNNMADDITPGTTARMIEFRMDEGPGLRRILAFLSVYYRNGNTKVKLMGFNEAGDTVPIGGLDLTDGSNQRLEIELVLASGPGANDGVGRLIKGNTVKEITNWDLYLGGTSGIDQVRFGVVKSPDAGSLGTYFLDSYESFRTLAP